jgi:hypothetical protein
MAESDHKKVTDEDEREREEWLQDKKDRSGPTIDGKDYWTLLKQSKRIFKVGDIVRLKSCVDEWKIVSIEPIDHFEEDVIHVHLLKEPDVQCSFLATRLELAK